MRWAIPSRRERRANSSGVSSGAVRFGADFVEVADEVVVDGSVDVSVGVVAVGVVGDDGSFSEVDGLDTVDVDVDSGIDGDAERNAGSE